MSASASALPSAMPLTLDVKPSHPDDSPDFALIRSSMHGQGIRALQIRHMYRLNIMPPSSLLAESGTSPLSALRLTEAGPPAAALACLLSWPRALHAIQIICCVDYPSGLNRYAFEAGHFTVSGLMAALAPQKRHLEHIYYRACYDNKPCHLQDGPADFRGFVALRTLDLPLDVLWHESDESELASNGGSIDLKECLPPPLDRVLPASLQELVLDVSGSGNGFFWLDDDDQLQESEASRDLFAWLSGIPSTKKTGAPNLEGLRSVRINTEGQEPRFSPLDCEHTRAVREAFHECGVALTWSPSHPPTLDND